MILLERCHHRKARVQWAHFLESFRFIYWLKTLVWNRMLRLTLCKVSEIHQQILARPFWSLRDSHQCATDLWCGLIFFGIHWENHLIRIFANLLMRNDCPHDHNYPNFPSRIGSKLNYFFTTMRIRLFDEILFKENGKILRIKEVGANQYNRMWNCYQLDAKNLLYIFHNY